MARTTSTQRGASRRTTRSASGGPGARGASASRSRKPAAAARGRKPAVSRSRARRPAGPWLPVGIVALVVVLAWALYPALRLQYQGSRRMAGLEQQYVSLKARNDALRAQVAALKTPQGVEKAAREGLGYAKAGENVYVVIPSGQATSAQAGVTGVSAASAAATPVPSLLQLVLDALFGVVQPTSTVEP
jgi:cell division protein FtsB